MKVRSLDKDISDSISSNIKSICSDFSSLKKVQVLSTLLHIIFTIFSKMYFQSHLQVLQAKEELSNVKLAKELPKTVAPLNAIIEDIVICNEELANLINE